MGPNCDKSTSRGTYRLPVRRVALQDLLHLLKGWGMRQVTRPRAHSAIAHPFRTHNLLVGRGVVPGNARVVVGGVSVLQKTKTRGKSVREAPCGTPTESTGMFMNAPH